MMEYSTVNQLLNIRPFIDEYHSHSIWQDDAVVSSVADRDFHMR